MNKKTYVLTVSQFFPTTHPRKGEKTGFVEKIKSGEKIHTIRGNYLLWKKRIDAINKGEAILSLRYWSGRPYNTPQIEVLQFEKVGIEKIEFTPLGYFIDGVDIDYTTEHFAKNDGLSERDFKAWFKGWIGDEKAIIHFTDFKYLKY